jgi:hypothetical protein
MKISFEYFLKNQLKKGITSSLIFDLLNKTDALMGC